MIISPDGYYHYGLHLATADGEHRNYFICRSNVPLLVDNAGDLLTQASKASNETLGTSLQYCLTGVDILAVPNGLQQQVRLPQLRGEEVNPDTRVLAATDGNDVTVTT
jgi:hypothetical protein